MTSRRIVTLRPRRGTQGLKNVTFLIQCILYPFRELYSLKYMFFGNRVPEIRNSLWIEY